MQQLNEIFGGPDIPSFSQFFKKKRGTRTQRGVTGMARLHQNLLPAVHRKNPSLNRKVEDMRKHKGNTRKVLTAQDIGYITRKYNIRNITKASPRMLGKTGIKMYYDVKLGGWCLTQ